MRRRTVDGSEWVRAVPRTWDDVGDLVTNQVPESRHLDFKRTVSSNSEIAKDVAAMSLDGGVLVYGVDEDQSQAASSLTPVALRTVVTKIEQIAASSVDPPLSPEVTPLPDPSNPDEGVVVVVVSPSPNAPHMTGGRYPARSGTVTRYLDEAEVARLYERRSGLRELAGQVENLVDSPQSPVPVGPGVGGVGRLRVVVRSSAVPYQHPDDPKFREPLRRARDRVISRHGGGLVAAGDQSEVLEGLGEWNPNGTVGWTTREPADGHALLEHNSRQSLTAVYTYAGLFGFELRWNLQITDPATRHPAGPTCAREFIPAVEMTALAAFTGEFFADVPAAGMLSFAVSVGDVEGALSFQSTRARPEVIHAGTPTATAAHSSTTVQALTARDEPTEVATALLGRWLVSLVSDPGSFVRGLWRPIGAEHSVELSQPS